jgi:hypothetical protein
MNRVRPTGDRVSSLGSRTRIESSVLGPEIGLIGAGAPALDRFFGDPLDTSFAPAVATDKTNRRRPAWRDRWTGIRYPGGAAVRAG